MWQEIQYSLDNGDFVDLGPYGYAGLIRIDRVRHDMGRKCWWVSLTHANGDERLLRVGKTKVLEVI